MTTPSDPPRRKDPSREPPTIDLKATSVDAARDARPAEAPATVAPVSAEAPAPVTAAPAEADATAVANEGPVSEPAASPPPSLTDDGTPPVLVADAPAETEKASAGAGRDGVDPTVPIPDPDMARPEPPRTASVPPVPPVRPRPEPETRRSPGFGALAGAGLVGGLVGGGLIYGLQAWRTPPAQSDPRIAQIEQRLAAVPRADAIQAADRRITALEAAQGEIAQRAAETRTLAEQAASRAEEAANRPSPAAPEPAPVGPATPAPALPADLTERLAALEAALRAASAPSDLTSKVAALEAETRDRAQGTAASIQALEARFGEADQSLERRLTEANRALEQRIAGSGETLERRLTEFGQILERRLGQGDERLAAFDRKLSEWNAEALRAGFRVVLAGRLNEALAQGAPFADVLGGLQRFEIAPERLRPLQPLAASGAPTAVALAQEFQPVSERILREARGEAGGIGDRILRMAEKVVSIRPVDDPASGEAPALVARIENALARGALTDAAAAWDALPEPARRVSDAWGARLKARVAAESAARGIAAEAIAALNAAPR